MANTPFDKVTYAVFAGVLAWCLLFGIVFAVVFFPEPALRFYLWWLRFRYPFTGW